MTDHVHTMQAARTCKIHEYVQGLQGNINHWDRRRWMTWKGWKDEIVVQTDLNVKSMKK